MRRKLIYSKKGAFGYTLWAQLAALTLGPRLAQCPVPRLVRLPNLCPVRHLPLTTMATLPMSPPPALMKILSMQLNTCFNEAWLGVGAKLHTSSTPESASVSNPRILVAVAGELEVARERVEAFQARVAHNIKLDNAADNILLYNKVLSGEKLAWNNRIGTNGMYEEALAARAFLMTLVGASFARGG